jgi:hypothetical protein
MVSFFFVQCVFNYSSIRTSGSSSSSSSKVCTTTTTMYFKQGVHSGKECAKRDIVFCLGLGI